MKKIVAMMLVLALVFSVGCGKKNEKPGETGETTEVVAGTGEVASNPKLVAEVGENLISKEDFEKNLALLKYNYTRLYGEDFFESSEVNVLGDLKKNLLEDMINEVIVISEAKKQGVKVEQTEIDQAYDNYMKKNFGTPESPVESSEVLNSYFEKNKIDEAFIKKSIGNQLVVNHFLTKLSEEIKNNEAVFNEYAENMTMEVKVAHILVQDEAKANEIYEQLKADPNKMAELAAQNSLDPGSKDNGGEVGFFGRGMMAPEFEKASFEGAVGEVQKPVKTQFGYHIIIVKEKRNFNQMKESLKDEAALNQAKTRLVRDALRLRYFEILNKAKDSLAINRYSLD